MASLYKLRENLTILEAAGWLADALDESFLSMESEIYHLCLGDKLRLCWQPSDHYGVVVVPSTILLNWFSCTDDDPTAYVPLTAEIIEAELGSLPTKIMTDGWELQEEMVSSLRGVYEIKWKESSLELWLLSLAKGRDVYDNVMGGLYLKSLDDLEHWIEVRELLNADQYSRKIDDWFPSNHRPDVAELIILRSDLEKFVESLANDDIASSGDSSVGPFILPSKPDDLARAICRYGNDYFSKHGVVPAPMILMDLVRDDVNRYGVQIIGDNGTGIAYINSASELKKVSKKSYLMRYNRYLSFGSNKPN